ncbi:hypothetical protein [Symbiopectobacterium sp. RP]|uniref:hypothetical protein n=1 Tax=Symbiopectobacterium sp. RP TaxID=3248553 RepID=UPI003D2A1088
MRFATPVVAIFKIPLEVIMTNLSVMPFSFEYHQVRTVIIGGEPWFVALKAAAWCRQTQGMA